tara:strand:+ start:361 stop:858 length:498 start_codon:yes stop_codon:yes gene_type:complete
MSQATHWRKLILERATVVPNEDYSALLELIDERETELGHPEVTLEYWPDKGELPYRFNLSISVQPVEEFDLFNNRTDRIISTWSSRIIRCESRSWNGTLCCVALVPKELLDEFHAAIERDDPTEVDGIRRSIEIEITKLIHPLAMALCRSLREYHESKKGSKKAS